LVSSYINGEFKEHTEREFVTVSMLLRENKVIYVYNKESTSQTFLIRIDFEGNKTETEISQIGVCAKNLH